MSQFVLIISMALVVYGVRLSGFYLSRAPLPAFAQRALGRLPVAVFAALVVLSLPGQAGEAPIRLVAAIGAGIALWYGRRPWIGLLVGMGLFWLLRAL